MERTAGAHGPGRREVASGDAPGAGGAVDARQGLADRRWRRQAALLAVAVFTLLTVSLSALNVRLFVSPRTGALERADAVVVLSGDHGERLPIALRLVEQGAAPTLVLAGTPDYEAWVELCEEAQPFEVVCIRPQPDSTRAEARATGELAHERGWKSLAVVTTSYHVTRSAMLFGRCFEGTVSMVAVDRSLGWPTALRHIGSEWLKVVHTGTLERSC